MRALSLGGHTHIPSLANEEMDHILQWHSFRMYRYVCDFGIGLVPFLEVRGISSMCRATVWPLGSYFVD